MKSSTDLRSPDQQDSFPSSGQWSWPLKSFASLIIAMHVLAIFSEPMQMFSRSNLRNGRDSSLLRGTLAPYIEMFYLDHGYFFFAPNPGPNHLVECSIRSKESKDQSFRFPDKRLHRPRLYYHRHFMLSEFYNNTHAWIDQPYEATKDPQIDLEWRSDLARYLRLQHSMLDHLRAQYPESTLELRRIEHQLPNDYRVLVEKWRLDDPRLYETLPESLKERDRIMEEPLAPPSVPSVVSPSTTSNGEKK